MRQWVASIVMTFACFATATPKTSDLVKGQLFADTESIMTGRTFRLGVRLEMSPNWHVYWKHPGETGLPTTVVLTLPQGFVAGEVQYPIPRRFVQPGDIEGFGYSDEVVMLIDVTPPERISDRIVSIEAAVSYLVCEKICLPGKMTLQIELPVSNDGAASINVELFAEWKARVPLSAQPTQVSGELPRDATTSMTDFSVTIPLPEPGGDLEIFPQTPDSIQTNDWSVEGGDACAVVRFKARLLKGFELKENSLPILLAYTDPRGNRKGINTKVALRKAPSVDEP